MKKVKKVVAYVNKDGECRICEKVMPYLRHISEGGRLIIRDGNRLERIWDRYLKAEVRADFAWQGDKFPLVYIDGKYQDLDYLFAKVVAWDAEHAIA